MGRALLMWARALAAWVITTALVGLAASAAAAPCDMDNPCPDGFVCVTPPGACRPDQCDDGVRDPGEECPDAEGACAGGTCTWDCRCDRGGGDPCVGKNCDDGNPCTADFCSVGECISSPIDCDDGNGCTDDSCNGGVCRHAFAARCLAPITDLTLDDGIAEKPVSGTRLLIKNGASGMRLKATIGGVEPSNADITRVVTEGAVVRVFNAAGGADALCARLDASGWRVAGSGASRLLTYRDRTSTPGPCDKAMLKRGVLSLFCRGRDYSLDEPRQGAVALTFGAGLTDYCTVFGGEVVKDAGRGTGAGVFDARKAPAPAACPAPIGVCPDDH